MSTWRNRVVGSGTLRIDDALFHPDQWRIHTKEQQAALGTVLETVGWVQQVIVSQNSGYLLDGHCRVALAERMGESEVPCVFVDVTPDEERLILASLDPIGAMAVTDEQKLAELVASIEAEDESVAKLLATVEEKVPEVDEHPPSARSVTCPECGFVFEPTAP